MPKINREDLNTLWIICPPENEQVCIESILAKWDLAIALTEKLLTEKQQLRNGLMHRLLTGKRRLPGFTKPWRKIRLRDAFRNRVESNRTDLPLLSIAADRGVIPRSEIDRKDSSSEDKSKYLRICPGDIGYNTMRMWQGVSGLSFLEGIVSPAYTIITSKKGIDGEFMSLLFKSLPVVHLFCRYSQGLVSDTWNLKFRHFAEILVTVPDEAEQKAIANAFRIVNRDLELLQAKANTLREQKKGLMQQLLTGKIRVTACAS
jgi:type I restriction enzyme S subunit